VPLLVLPLRIQILLQRDAHLFPERLQLVEVLLVLALVLDLCLDACNAEMSVSPPSPDTP
jgi:hypothetical protein